MKNQYFLPSFVPKPFALFLDLSGNATELPGAAQVLWETLWRPGARARGVRPASKLVPGDFWQPKTIKNQ